MKIAITGGIGVGKSFVCQSLQSRGIEVYDCDRAAKRLMRTSIVIRQRLIGLVGPEAYQGDVLQKAVLATFLMQSEENKQAVNDIVHPVVAADFEQSGIDWLESAILFESGFDKRTHFDRVICVTAPDDVRVARIMARDQISEEKAIQWVRMQMSQERIVEMSDYEIVNDGAHDIEKQIHNIINRL